METLTPISKIGNPVIPVEVQPCLTDSNPRWAIALGGLVDGDFGIRRAIARLEPQELRELAGEIALWDDVVLPHALTAWGQPQLDRPRFWFDGVLPLIQRELDRRDRNLREWAYDQSYAPRSTTARGKGTRSNAWRDRRGHLHLPAVEVVI